VADRDQCRDVKKSPKAELRLIPAIHMAAHAIALYVSSAKELGVSQAEAHVLAHLHERGSSSVSDIHSRFGHRRSTLTSVLDRLADAGFVKRSTAQDDRRSVNVDLTARGREMSSKVHALLLRLEQRARSQIKAADAIAAESTLHALVDVASREGDAV
jgi:DNA-binding MarR family transcriptional regulator